MGKVIKTRDSKDNSIRYSLVESEVKCDGEKALTYGVRIERLKLKDDKGSEMLDITTNLEKAETLFDKMVDLEIHPVTLKNVAEDFVNA